MCSSFVVACVCVFFFHLFVCVYVCGGVVWGKPISVHSSDVGIDRVTAVSVDWALRVGLLGGGWVDGIDL
jgi:hypothetical protein